MTNRETRKKRKEDVRRRISNRSVVDPFSGYFSVDVRDIFDNSTPSTVRYRVDHDFIYLMHEFVVAVDYLRACSLVEHPFLIREAHLQLAPTVTSGSLFEMPTDQVLNDFLMRLRPFLFQDDMFYWKTFVLKDVKARIVSNTEYVSSILAQCERRFNGLEFGSLMEKAKEAKLFLEGRPGDLGRPRSIGDGQLLAHALSGGHCNITYKNIQTWLFGKKYHYNLTNFKMYKRLLNRIPEEHFFQAARLYFTGLLEALFYLRNLILRVLQELRKEPRARILSVLARQYSL